MKLTLTPSNTPAGIPPAKSTEDREPPKPKVANGRPLLIPNHPHEQQIQEMYGIMKTLGLLKRDDSLMLLMHMKRWDQWLVEWLDHPLVSGPEEAMCILIQQMFNALRLPLSRTAMGRVNAQTKLIQR